MLDLLAPNERLQLRIGEYVRLHLAESSYALASDNVERCIVILENILRQDRDQLDPILVMLAHLWKARAHRIKADYGKALEHITIAHDLARALPGSETLLAIVQVQQG